MPQPRALKTAQAAFEADSSEVKEAGELVILPEQNGDTTFYLTWKIRLFSLNPLQDITYFVDAKTGQIVYDFSNLRDYAAHESLHASADKVRDGATGPSPAHDGENRHVFTASASSPLHEATTLAAGAISGSVTGAFFPEHPNDPTTTTGFATKDITLYNEAGSVVARRTTTNGSYSFTGLAPGAYIVRIPLQSSWTQPRNGGGNTIWQDRSVYVGSATVQVNQSWGAGNAQNVKYHVDRAHTFWTSDPFFFSEMNYQMRAHVDQGAGVNGRADGTNLFFGTQDINGDGIGEQFARSSDVVYHEYAHNSIYHIYDDFICVGCPAIPRNDTELMRRAMDEGFADYFAATLNEDPRIGEQVALPSSRNVNNNTRTYVPYSSTFQDPYWNGGVIGGACWDLEEVIGEYKTRRLIFRAMQITPHARTFANFAYNMVVADQNFYGGDHRNQIIAAFNAHGITAQYPPPVAFSVGLYGPSTLSSNQTGNYTANVSGEPNPTITYKWYFRPAASSCPATGTWNLQRTVTKASDSDAYSQYPYTGDDFELKVEVTSGGQTKQSTKCVTVTGGGYNVAEGALTATGALVALPTAYALEANYPNPFNPTTEIRFALPEAADVRLVVYDALGREVERLVDGPVGAGYQHATFDAANLPSGLYLYRLEARGGQEAFAKTGQMVLVK